MNNNVLKKLITKFKLNDQCNLNLKDRVIRKSFCETNKIEAKMDNQLETQLDSKINNELDIKIDPELNNELNTSVDNKADNKINNKLDNELETQLDTKIETNVIAITEKNKPEILVKENLPKIKSKIKVKTTNKNKEIIENKSEKLNENKNKENNLKIPKKKEVKPTNYTTLSQNYDNAVKKYKEKETKEQQFLAKEKLNADEISIGKKEGVKKTFVSYLAADMVIGREDDGTENISLVNGLQNIINSLTKYKKITNAKLDELKMKKQIIDEKEKAIIDNYNNDRRIEHLKNNSDLSKFIEKKHEPFNFQYMQILTRSGKKTGRFLILEIGFLNIEIFTKDLTKLLNMAQDFIYSCMQYQWYENRKINSLKNYIPKTIEQIMENLNKAGDLFRKQLTEEVSSLNKYNSEHEMAFHEKLMSIKPKIIKHIRLINKCFARMSYQKLANNFQTNFNKKMSYFPTIDAQLNLPIPNKDINTDIDENNVEKEVKEQTDKNQNQQNLETLNIKEKVEAKEIITEQNEKPSRNNSKEQTANTSINQNKPKIP